MFDLPICDLRPCSCLPALPCPALLLHCPSAVARLRPSRSPVLLAAVELARAVGARRVCVYQSASKTIKRQTDGGAKASEIRAELLFDHARGSGATARTAARSGLLNRRRPMRFRETIGQHFRRVLVSKRFRSCKRGRSHVMGTGAIDARAIEIASTETSEGVRATFIAPRRRRSNRTRRGPDKPVERRK
jgi:hypothetical protein